MAVPKRRRSEIARRLVTIPKAVDDALRQHPEVNWSAVAAKAFGEALTKLKKGER